MVSSEVVEYCRQLTDVGIDNEPLEHPASREIRGVLDALGLDFEDCVPALVMMADGAPVVIVIRGDTRADSKKIKRLLNAHDLRMATPAEFEAIAHVPLGAARVYNPGIRTIIDEKVFEKEYLTGGSGRFDVSIRVRTNDLRKMPDSEVGDVSKAA